MTNEIVSAEIEEMTKRLRLPHIRRGFLDLALSARAQRWDPMELIRVLFETEIQGRNASTLLIRRAAANLPGNRSLSGFDHSISSVPTQVINGLANLEWVKLKEGGKTLAQPLVGGVSF